MKIAYLNQLYHNDNQCLQRQNIRFSIIQVQNTDVRQLIMLNFICHTVYSSIPDNENCHSSSVNNAISILLITPSQYFGIILQYLVVCLQYHAHIVVLSESMQTNCNVIVVDCQYHCLCIVPNITTHHPHHHHASTFDDYRCTIGRCTVDDRSSTTNDDENVRIGDRCRQIMMIIMMMMNPTCVHNTASNLPPIGASTIVRSVSSSIHCRRPFVIHSTDCRL